MLNDDDFNLEQRPKAGDGSNAKSGSHGLLVNLEGVVNSNTQTSFHRRKESQNMQLNKSKQNQSLASSS